MAAKAAILGQAAADEDTPLLKSSSSGVPRYLRANPPLAHPGRLEVQSLPPRPNRRFHPTTAGAGSAATPSSEESDKVSLRAFEVLILSFVQLASGHPSKQLEFEVALIAC